MLTRDMNGVDRDRGAAWVRLVEVVDGLEADLDVLVGRVEVPVLARVEAQLGPSGALQDSVRRGVMIGVRDALARLRAMGELPDEMPADLIHLARRRRDRANELPDFADAWLAGQDVFWDCFGAMTERVLEDTALCWDVLKVARQQLSGRAARMFELLRCPEEDGCEQPDRANTGSRFRAVSRVLRGQWVGADELGYNVASSHVALIADTPSLLDALADHTGREVLHVDAPADGVWGWLGGRSRLSEAELDELLAWQRSREGQVAFGEPAEGIAGFSTSHHQALETRSIAHASGDSVLRFAEVRLLIAVLRDSQLARGFVERELGDLDHPGERMAELRATLRVYLEQGQSISTTAALRRRNRKTIQRQLRAVEQLINHYVRDRSDELLIAMRASEILRSREPMSDSPSGASAPDG